MESLKKYLERSNSTQAELAKALGVSQPTVSDWIRGTMRPSISRLNVISEVTGIPFRRLVDELAEFERHPAA